MRKTKIPEINFIPDIILESRRAIKRVWVSMFLSVVILGASYTSFIGIQQLLVYKNIEATSLQNELYAVKTASSKLEEEVNKINEEQSNYSKIKVLYGNNKPISHLTNYIASNVPQKMVLTLIEYKSMNQFEIDKMLGKTTNTGAVAFSDTPTEQTEEEQISEALGEVAPAPLYVEPKVYDKQINLVSIAGEADSESEISSYISTLLYKEKYFSSALSINTGVNPANEKKTFYIELWVANEE